MSGARSIFMVKSSFFLILSASFSLLFAARTDAEMNPLLESAQKAAADGQVEQAETLFQQISDQTSDSDEAILCRRELAILAIRSQRTAKAQSHVQSLKTDYSANPATAEALYSIARQWGWHTQPEEAIALHTYNSAAFASVKEAMWSQVEIIFYEISRQDMKGAQAAYEVLLERFATQETLPKEIYQIGQHYQQASQKDKALELYRHVTDRYPHDPYGLLCQQELICEMIRKGDLRKAQSGYADLLNRADDPNHLARPLYLIGMAYLRSDNAQKALDVHRYNAAHCTNTEHGLLSQGEVMIHGIHQEDLTAAEADYQFMLTHFAREPMLCREIYHMAGVYAVRGYPEQAMALHRYNAQTYGDRDFGRWSHVELILNLTRMKDFAAAQAECDAFAGRYADDPTLGKELYILAREFIKTGDRERGFQLHLYNVEHARESDHTRWSGVEVVFHYIDMKAYENAESACLRFIERYADHPELGMEIGNFLNRYAANGDIARAERLCRRAMKAHPAHPAMAWMQSGLVRVYLDRMADADADAAFETLLSGHGENPELIAVIKSLGQYCTKQYQDSGMAVQFYSRFLARYADHPNAFEIETERIRTYIELKAAKQAGGAIEQLARRYPRRPDMADVLIGLANQCHQVQLYPTAVEVNRRVLAGNPGAGQQMEAYAGLAKSWIRLEAAADPDWAAAQGIDADEIIRLLMKDGKAFDRLGFHIFQIGEEYYFRAEEARRTGHATEADDDFRKAIRIWHYNIDAIADSRHRCLAHYYSGISYQRLHDYKKAADCYEQTVNGWPQFEHRGYALSMLAECYGILKLNNEIPPGTADRQMKAAYERLVAEFPSLPQSQLANEWLKANSRSI